MLVEFLFSCNARLETPISFAMDSVVFSKGASDAYLLCVLFRNIGIANNFFCFGNEITGKLFVDLKRTFAHPDFLSH